MRVRYGQRIIQMGREQRSHLLCQFKYNYKQKITENLKRERKINNGNSRKLNKDVPHWILHYKNVPH